MKHMAVSVPTIFFLDCLSEIQNKASNFGFLAVTLLILKELASNFACIIGRTYSLQSNNKRRNSVPNLGCGQ